MSRGPAKGMCASLSCTVNTFYFQGGHMRLPSQLLTSFLRLLDRVEGRGQPARGADAESEVPPS